MKLSAVVRALVSAGASPEMILAAIEAAESTNDDVLAKRRASDAARQKAKRVRQSHVTSRDVTVTANGNADGEKSNENNDSEAALARVRDNPSRLVISGETVVDVSVRAGEQPDDWPEGNPVEALIAEVGSPRLDPSKSHGLHLTAGRLVAWRRDGASWQFDVLPVVKAACAKAKTPIGTWKYFDTAISVSIAENRRALEIPDAAATPRGQGPPTTLAAQIGAENAEARRRAFELLDARKTQNG